MVHRKKIIFLLIFILAGAVLIYAAKDMFFQQAKNWIKYSLEKNLPCKFSLGQIKVGLFYGLVLEDLEISFPQGYCGLGLNIKVAESYIDYNLWQDMFLRRHKDVQRLRLVSPQINIFNLQTQPAQPDLTGYNQMPKNNETTARKQPKKSFSTGEFVLSLENGSISFTDKPNLVRGLEGKIIFSQGGLYFQDLKAGFLDSPPGVLKVYGELSSDRLSLTANLEHLKVGYFDILTNVSLDLNRKALAQDGGAKILGNFKTYGSVLNNRPIPELDSSFEIEQARLRILNFSLGENYSLRGVVHLSRPRSLDLSLNFYQAEPKELFFLLAAPVESATGFDIEKEVNFSGLINGLIKINGELANPQVEGYLEAKDGHVGDMYFVSADVSIKGRYPKFVIKDSHIFREDDSLAIEGELDFSDLDWQNFAQLKLEPNKGMLWQGWDITRKREDQVHMSKGVADDFKITFDTYMKGSANNFENNYTNELGLEYQIMGDKIIKLRMREEEGIVGLEQRMKF